MSHSEKIQPPAIGSVIPTGSPDFLPERNDRSGKKLWVKLKNNYTPAQNSTPGGGKRRPWCRSRRYVKNSGTPRGSLQGWQVLLSKHENPISL